MHHGSSEEEYPTLYNIIIVHILSLRNSCWPFGYYAWNVTAQPFLYVPAPPTRGRVLHIICKQTRGGDKDALDLQSTKMFRSATLSVAIVACISVGGCRVIEDFKSPILFSKFNCVCVWLVSHASCSPSYDPTKKSRKWVWSNGSHFPVPTLNLECGQSDCRTAVTWHWWNVNETGM